MGSFELTDRSRRLLTTLVREYIETGEPVASQALARSSGLGVSSATIRNVLAQLEAAGYVHQPHTSAGRVPTDRAYRVFVDMLLEGRKPSRVRATVETRLREQAGRALLIDDLLASVSHLVSRAARQVGFAMAVNHGAVLQRIDFVPIGGRRVLVVVISGSNQVTQKVIDAADAIGGDELVQAANYLNTEFAGLTLFEIREAVRARLEQDRTLYDQLLAKALRLAHSTLEELPSTHALHVEGVASLLSDTQSLDAMSLSTLRALVEMMEEKQRLVYLLNQYIDGPGLTVVIGMEHAAPDLRPFSLIASTAVEGNTMQTVGVIGPTRMRYSRAIALVDGTTRAVSRVLRQAN